MIFPAAVYTTWRDFRANLGAIVLLAVGLAIGVLTIQRWPYGSTIVAERHALPAVGIDRQRQRLRDPRAGGQREEAHEGHQERAQHAIPSAEIHRGN